MPRPDPERYDLTDAEKRDLIKLIEQGARIPTGFRPKAQGCEQRATLGNRRHDIHNPNGVVAISYASFPRRRCRNPVGVGGFFSMFTQGSSFLATLGFGTQSLWDCQTSNPNGVAATTPT